MAQVTLRINGYVYMVGCRDGEEQHLLAMAQEVERKIDLVKTAAGQSGEARMVVMASLIMADELDELRKRVAELEAERTTEAVRAPDPKLGRRISRAAKRAEEIAANMDQA